MKHVHRIGFYGCIAEVSVNCKLVWHFVGCTLLYNCLWTCLWMDSSMFVKFPDSIISLTFLFVAFFTMAATVEFVEYVVWTFFVGSSIRDVECFQFFYEGVYFVS